MSRSHNQASRQPRRQEQSSGKLHQITFCEECHEGIPAKAVTCYHCGAKQARAEDAVQVVFCDRCGKDYPFKAMACFHCGHQNLRHPYVKGTITHD
ncbi:MAG: double zinc ribbon domain-containing protein [Planctomycetota bacterium]|jgi:ribosomal protein L40E